MQNRWQMTFWDGSLKEMPSSIFYIIAKPIKIYKKKLFYKNKKNKKAFTAVLIYVFFLNEISFLLFANHIQY